MSRPQSVHIWVNNKGKMYILNSAYSFNISLYKCNSGEQYGTKGY